MIDLQSFTPILAGIIGTAIMSIFTLFDFIILKRPYYVVRTLVLILIYGKGAT
ncbi:MAG TPA: hypothetical protein VD884_11645 [Ohtaekwangia sp.]|nr:hypothetical protein [Ohtaekwangia sp.]